jgi:colicin import membrane protein
MLEFLRKHWAYLLAALALHAVFAGIFGLTMLSISRQPPPVKLAIEAMVVDQSVLNRAARQQQRERDRAQAQERERVAAEQRKREAEQRAQEQRQAELKQVEEEERRRQVAEQQAVERKEAERKRQAEEERQQRAEAERKRVAEIERKQKEEAQKRRAAEESRAQAAREDELRRQLEEEEGRMEAQSAGLQQQYIAMIEEHIYSYWRRPPSARPGIECIVTINQSPAGAVLSVKIGRCDGDTAVRQSIEAAVQRASPLPEAPDPRVFQRAVILQFRPRD